MATTRIHHINFVVRDLAKSIDEFRRILGLEAFELIDHSPRGAKVARSRIGDAWFVLVCPNDPDSVPGRFLAEHGEGFFLLSLGTNDLDGQLRRLESEGVDLIDAKARDGIRDWRVADITTAHGVLLQLTHD